MQALRENRFIKSVAAVSSGNILGAITQVLFAPILGRIYTPFDYGLLGAYLSVSALLVGIGNWQLSQGIIVEKSEVGASALFAGCMWATGVTALVSSLVAIVVIVFPERFSITTHRWWYAMLPLSATISGVSGAMSALANRRGLYAKIGVAMFLPGLATAILSVALGLYWRNALGLFVSYIVGQLLMIVLYVWVLRGSGGKPHKNSRRKVCAMLRKHHRFALYTMPTGFLTSACFNAPVYFLTGMNATAAIGLFSRANQLLLMPTQLVGNSIAVVFQREATLQYQQHKTCWPIYRRTMISLFGIGLLPTVILAVFSPQIFAFVLGPNWRDAGVYARILAPMLLLRMVCSPLATVFYIAGKQKEDFVLSLLTSLFMLICVAVGYFSVGTPVAVVSGFAIGYSMTYLVFMLRAARHSVRFG